MKARTPPIPAALPTAETLLASVLRTDRAATPDARKRLIREAVLARNIRHANVVAVYDVGEDAGQPYMAMEHLGGRSLRSWMRERLLQRGALLLRHLVEMRNRRKGFRSALVLPIGLLELPVHPVNLTAHALRRSRPFRLGMVGHPGRRFPKWRVMR